MIMLYQENIKQILILVYQVKDILKMKLKKYCYMWKDGGQFSTEKYKKNDLKSYYFEIIFFSINSGTSSFCINIFFFTFWLISIKKM